uniref:Conserved oligomeric Golgi complex subunit 3 n=1 Tax=Strigamia maritima TaxID=126957 RepID=T1J4T0_STRMM
MNSIKNKLLDWENLEDPIAPLSSKQRESILELTSYANTRPFPVDLPQRDSPNQVSSSNVSADFLETLPHYFSSLQSGKLVIENGQQFYTWFAKVEEDIVEKEDSEYRNFVKKFEENCEQCNNLLGDVMASLNCLTTLHKQYLFVSNKTNSLHEACEQQLQDQIKLMSIAENISNKLAYFDELDKISQRLSSPTMSVLNESFVPILTRLDECIDHMLQNPQFKDGSVYLARFKHNLTKALGLIRAHVINSLQSATQKLLPKKEAIGPTDNSFTLFYGKFRTNAHKIKSLMEQIEDREEKSSECKQLIADCHQCYFQQRELLLQPSVVATINDLATNHQRDHCALVRSGCAFLLHVCEDEYQLYFQFFTKHSLQLDEFLEGLCCILYDVLRPLIIHIHHLETLSELCSILKIEMIDEHIRNNPEHLKAFEAVVTQMLQDVQERLVYRTHIYIQSDILNYNPSPGDLVYPEKLEMMESIAEGLMQQSSLSRSESRSSIASFGSLTSQEVAGINSAGDHGSEVSLARSRTGPISPADLHGMWYPTVRRTLVCLSKLYRCIDKAIFQGLSQDALSMCIQSLVVAGSTIAKNKTLLDGLLFQIKHLLILREQIAPFQVDFAIREMSLDFSKVRTAATNFMHRKSKLFALNTNNSLLEFILQGTPQVTEHYIDSKKDVDNHLKLVCEQFIQHTTELLIGSLKSFTEKAAVIIKLKEGEGGRQVTLKNQPFASVDKIAELIAESNRQLKGKLPSVNRNLRLYLANRETEAILFRPIRTNIQSVYSHLLQIVRTNYSDEDQLIIACPSNEQVSIMLTAALTK